MKICPKCSQTFDDSWSACVKCGVGLEHNLESRLAGLEEQAKRILIEIESIRKGESAPAKLPPKDAAAAVSTPPAAPREDTESRIGKYVLSKIGVVSIVASIGFFLSYAFKYLSPFVKLAIGFAAGAGVIAFGARIEKNPKYKWYGRGLICGGWVAVYFTAYAMYHIKATRVLPSQSADLVLLGAVIAAMVWHLLKYRSESMIILVMIMGYLTAGISTYASFAFSYITILAAAAGFLLVRTGWRTAGAFALLGTYATHFAWVRPHAPVHPADSEFWTSLGFLAAYWMIYNFTAWFYRAETPRERNEVAAFILANSALFGLVAILEVRAAYPGSRSVFALAAAGILLLFSLMSSGRKGKEYLKTAFLIAAIAFVSGSLRYSLGKNPAYLAWCFEVPVLMFAGLYLSNHLYRAAAAALSLAAAWGMLTLFGLTDEKIVLAGRDIHWNLILYTAAAVSFFLTRYAYLVHPRPVSEEDLENRASHAYTLLASVSLLGAVYYEVHPKLVTLTWSSGALLLFVVGFILNDRVFRYCAIGIIAACVFRGIVTDLAGVNTVWRILVFLSLGLILLAVSFWYGKMSALLRDRKSSSSGDAKIWSGLFLLLIAVPIFAAAFVGPSQFRKESVAREREEAITASFIAGSKLGADETAFLRSRNFTVLERTLQRLPIDKEGRNLVLYERAFEIGLKSQDIYFRVGTHYEGKKETAKAIEAYEKVMALDPGFALWQTRNTANALARIYKDSGNYPRAAELYEKYLKYYKSVEILYELAVCYEKMGKLDKALEKLNEAVGINSGGNYAGEIESLRSDIYGKKEMLEKSE